MRVTAPPVTIKDIWDALTVTYGVAGSYGLLMETNLDAPVSTAGANLTTLETRLSAARATKLDNLDNIDAGLKDLFYEHFGTTVDDLPDITGSGTVDHPTFIINNDIGTGEPNWLINEYAEFNFVGPTYIKEIRLYGSSTCTGNGRYKLEYYDGTWKTAKTALVQPQTEWSAWTALTTPAVAIRWKLTCTTQDSGANQGWLMEMELKGVRIGT